ncbi:DUF523 and DUF1722 domain-containing protein [Methanolobus sp. WCC4]|uniref:YbgA family protein n=1 Tax=Methanolobus sp. WCC4 TaxID=3125784 RepID=UPI0030F582AA
MRQFPRPKVLVSRCLEFDNIRHDGHIVRSDIVRALMPLADLMPVCPEVEIGLGVPRDPLRIVRVNGEDRLIMPSTGEDLTDAMLGFTKDFLDDLGNIDGCIFKGHSPSMGIDDARVYAKASLSPVVKKSAGLFAGRVIDEYPGYPIEENDRLRNVRIRHHFLTHLYTFAAFRKAKADGSMEALIEFNRNNRFLFISYDSSIATEMSLLQGSEKEISLIFEEYGSLLGSLMRRPGSIDKKVNAARDMFFTLKDITQEEGSFFEDMLGRYADNRISEDAMIEVLRMLAFRTQGDVSYNNTFLYPYPEELKGKADETRDKEYWDK